ncbi:MAG: Lrp/AsnC family transcriptional regulator [Cohaesibacter sp.]|nr:Lrp/AsnC family transcriptional regulator [Cohaesibacter sp.]
MYEKLLDRIDLSILRELVRDGKISNTKLADKVGLSQSPCWQRVRRLEKEGYIKNYTAILDAEKLGAPEIAIIEISLDRHDQSALDRLGPELAKLPEVLEVYLTTGDYDYILKVAVDGTSGYEKFLRNRLYKVPGIRHSRTCFALQCFKQVHSYIPD